MRAKRLVLGVLLIFAFGLAAASVASADVWWNTTTNTGFIGRGDVIAYAGKDALVPAPFTRVIMYSDEVVTCHFSNGGTYALPQHTTWVARWMDTYGTTARYSGNGKNITGYDLRPWFSEFDEYEQLVGGQCGYQAYLAGTTLAFTTQTNSPWYGAFLTYTSLGAPSPASVDIPVTLIS